MIKNKPIQAHHCKKNMKVMVMFIFFSIFLFGSVSAFEWDNGLRYENNDLKVIVENGYFFGIGKWFGFNEDLGSAELKSHQSVDQIRPVKLGESVLMWYSFSNFSDLYEDGIGDIEIINVKTGERIERNYEFVYWGTETYTVPNYICDDSKKVMEEQCVKSGTKNQTIEKWLPYNSRDIPKGEIIIGLKMNILVDETLDLVWKIGGKKIEKHAVVSSGAVETTDGAFTILTYINNGTFNVTFQSINVSVLVVAGGGGGSSGGGGAGEVLNDSNFLVPVGNHNIVVGTGGEGRSSAAAGDPGVNGTNSSFTTLDARGGGGAGKNEAGGEGNGRNGGSGGGAGNIGGTTNIGGVGDQGDGGNSFNGGVFPSGGGGGAVADGTDGLTGSKGLGGVGLALSINATNITYGTGGDGIVNAETENGTDGTDGLGNGGEGSAQLGFGGDGGDGVVIIRFIPSDINITLISPENNANLTPQNVVFNVSVIIPNLEIENVTLSIDGIANETNTTGVNGTYIFNKIISDGDHNWSILAVNNISDFVESETRVFTIDSTSPTINITFPTEIINSHTINNNLSVNWTVSDLNLDTCILQFEGVNRTVTCLDNQTQINITNTVNRTIIFFANDTFGNINSSSRSWNYLSFQNLLTFNTSTFETARETFTVNITTNGTTPTSARLIYNGTEFTGATVTSLGGNDFNISRTIDIPLISGNNTLFHFNFSIASTEVSTDDGSQSVNLTTFEFCEVGQQPAYINFTFTNESVAEEAITAEIDTTWNFWLGSGSVIDSLTFSNTTENLNYQFCLTSGGNRTLTANVSLTYDNAESQLRSFTQEFNLTNTTTTQNLFLLPTADGIFVTFQVVNPSEQVISGVSANVTKDGDLISNGVTDDAGLITYFLDPDTSYVFSFSKVGFTTVSTTLVPTQTSFTIIMGAVTTVAEFDTTIGINYFINPINSTLLNGTLVEFSLTLNASNSNLDNFGFVLRNSTGTLFNETTSTLAAGGFLSVTLDTGSNTDIVMELFWTITGNQTNVTRTWLVFNLDNEGFSILTFFNDLSRFLNSGLFGLTSFGLGIIIFMILILVTGTVSLKFGITDPTAITLIVFSLVFFFDVTLGIMPNPVNAVNNFVTIFVGVILLGMLVREAVKF